MIKTKTTATSLFSTATAASSSSPTTSSDNNHKKLITFRKYEGLGNDFLLIDNRDSTIPNISPEQASQLCHRNFGVGADGVIFALQPPSPEYDFAMRIYNSDGSEPEMCGNGIRCYTQFLYDIGENTKTQYNVHTLAGMIIPVINQEEGTITVDMGEPILDASLIPTTIPPNFDDNSVVEQDVSYAGKDWKINAVSMGNPHCIIFVDDLEKDIDFNTDGPTLESATSLFPKKVNVEFVQVLSPTHLKMKVWERGAGPTLACGTGTCALVVAAIRAQKIPASSTEKVRVTLPGGDLFISWNPNTDNKVYMTGPAKFVFRGETTI